MNKELSKETKQILINSNITIQLAHLEQFNEIYELYNNRTKWFELNNIKQWPQYAERHRSELQTAIENDNYYIFKKGNEIIAGFEISNEPGYFNDDGQALYLHKVVVKVGYKNIGTLIFMVSKDIAKSNNKQYLRLDCVKNNEKLNEIYEKHGFKFVGTGKTTHYEYCLRECNVNE